MTQSEVGLPGLPLLANVVPFISQMSTCSVVMFRHRTSLLQSPLKSPTAANDCGFGFGFGFGVVQDPIA
jgi:hypothetical protein